MTIHTSRSMIDVTIDEYKCIIVKKGVYGFPKVAQVAAFVSALISYILQLYMIHKLFSITGKHNYILTDLFWVTALFIFVVTTVGIQGSSCLHLYTDTVVSVTGYFIFGYVMLLFCSDDLQH